MQPDVIHFEWNSAAIDALSVRRLWDIPVVVSCRGTQIRVRPFVTAGYADSLRQTFDRATTIHCVCETIRDEAVALGLDPAKAEVIYPGVDVDEFRPQATAPYDGPLRLLSVGALIWTKGYEYALLMLRLLLNRGIDTRLDIIGAGVERQRVLSTISDLGLANWVALHGQVPPLEVRRALGRADVFLHSSLSEGLSNAVLEAMACGVPVVTTDSGGMREAVTNGREGYLVPTRSPEASAAAVERLAKVPELRRDMGNQGRSTVLSKFRLDSQVDRFVALYSRISGVAAP